VLADPLIAARDGFRRRQGAGAMRGEDCGDRFSHARPRSGMSLVGGYGKECLRMQNTKGGLRSPLLTTLRD
jgi:hypothetical protein